MKCWLEGNIGNTDANGVSRRQLFRLAAESKLITNIELRMTYPLQWVHPINTLSTAATDCLFFQNPPCKPHSDSDIAVEMDSAIPRKTPFKIEEEFEEPNLNYQVDLLDLKRISDSFSKSIRHKLVAITPPSL